MGTLFAAAVIPGLLLSALYLLYIGVLSFLKPELAPPLPGGHRPEEPCRVLAHDREELLPPTFLIVLVLGSIFGGWATPTEAAGVGSFGALLLARWNGRLNYADAAGPSSRAAALTNAMVFFIFFGARCSPSCFARWAATRWWWSCSRAGLDTGWEILTFLMVLVFVLGFFFDWIEICLIVLPVFAPVLQGVDFSSHLGTGGPIVFLTWFIIMMSVNLQTSFLTPPFGFTLFYMKGTVPKA